MNTENNDLRFDRLVDGELSENERRELLAGLDAEPSGWRRCALAFLEAQCWKQTLRGVVQDSGAASPRTAQGDNPQGDSLIFADHSFAAVPGKLGQSPAERKTGQSPSESLDTRRSPWPGRLGTVLAMAASFMVAVWVGSLILSGRVGQSVSPTGIGPGNEIAKNIGYQLPPQSIQPENSLAATPPRVNAPSNPWQIVTVSSPSNGQMPARSFNVPAVERDNIDEQWMRGLPPAIPNNVLQALTRTGHEIKQHREFVPVPLKDGRQMVMPVDQVEVHYVGNGSY